jgi:hypothetical protein
MALFDIVLLNRGVTILSRAHAHAPAHVHAHVHVHVTCAYAYVHVHVHVHVRCPRSDVGSRGRTAARAVPQAECAHIAWLIAASHSHLSSLNAASASTV